MSKYDNNAKWIVDGAIRILKRLKYDPNKDVHQQFMERYGEKIESLPKKKSNTKKDFQYKKN